MSTATRLLLVSTVITTVFLLLLVFYDQHKVVITRAIPVPLIEGIMGRILPASIPKATPLAILVGSSSENTNSSYVIPLVTDTTGELRRVQARGVVHSFTDEQLIMIVRDKRVIFLLPQTVSLICLPESLPDEFGLPTRTSFAYVDVSRYTKGDRLVSPRELPSLFLRGSPVSVVANLLSPDQPVVTNVVGFGCSAEQVSS